MKIVVLDGYTLSPGDISWAPFERLGELVVYEYTRPEEIFSRLEGVSVCLTNKTCFPREVLEKLPDLRYIGCLSTGFNVVDVDYRHEYSGICHFCHRPDDHRPAFGDFFEGRSP